MTSTAEMGNSHLASEGTAALRERQFILETRLKIRDLGSVLRIKTLGLQSRESADRSIRQFVSPSILQLDILGIPQPANKAHSYLSASTGSNFEARSAGTSPLITPTSRRTMLEINTVRNEIFRWMSALPESSSNKGPIIGSVPTAAAIA